MDRRTLFRGGLAGVAALSTGMLHGCGGNASAAEITPSPLWEAWDRTVRSAKFVSLSHVLTQDIPLWEGFPATTKFTRGQGRLTPTDPYTDLTYEATGFETTAYTLSVDQFGTQLDPPAHWHQCMYGIDELPATLALRKLCVISIADKVAVNPAYVLTLDDVKQWESVNGALPEGAIVMIRSDWYKRWPDKATFVPADGRFPGQSLDALKYMHLERKVLMHGHEPLDTDATPTVLAEDWLMNNGYPQAEGVANLDLVPEVGALMTVGYPRFKGGTGGIASYVAICPSTWQHGAAIDSALESPFPIQDKRYVWNSAKGVRERTAACDKPKGKGSFNDFGK